MTTYIAFGVSTNFYSLVERLDCVCTIRAFCDNNSKYWGQYLMGDERLCVSPESLRNNDDVTMIIMAERESSICSIEKQCEEYGLKHIRVKQLSDTISFQPIACHWPQNIQNKRIHKFIELLVHGTTECNFHCDYCYVWRKQDFRHEMQTSDYSPQQIRQALSLEKLGGPCHINACALGETLLSKDIVELTYELLEEGHYISLITNGTVTSKINEILEFSDAYLERMFFKLSFHYEELKRTKLLDKFWENVQKIQNSPCSYSIEITPSDRIIDQIEEIKKEFQIHADGAMPHITFTRDGNKEGLDLLSKLSLKEYKDTWKGFSSDLFDLKCNLYKKKITEFCYAGNWSYRINVVNGNLQSCYQQSLCGTIFEENQKVLPQLTVGHHCNLEYCFNNHAFLAWGDCPDIRCSNYLSVRDRAAGEDKHWIKKSYAAAMSQKLYDNNFQYNNRWSDYTKLFDNNRKPAFILFNSPDYTNLGDHAIALAERKFFQQNFPTREFIEISCEQYIKENLLIQQVIQNEDIILLNGGGYIGSLWLWLEDLTRNIIDSHPNNKIVILPQTIYFENNSLGENEKVQLVQSVNKHENIIIMLRDEKSYYVANKLFSEKVDKLLVPDFVLSLSYNSDFDRNGCLTCFRDDKEKNNVNVCEINKQLLEQGYTVNEISTISIDEVVLDNRKEKVDEILDKFSHSKLVVTDRLHAMIFCAITHTPCIAFDNLSGKISGTYQWIHKLSWIHLCKKINDFQDILFNLDENNADYQLSVIYDEFNNLKTYIKEKYIL